MNQDKFIHIQQQQQHSILKSSSMDSKTFASRENPTNVNNINVNNVNNVT